MPYRCWKCNRSLPAWHDFCDTCGVRQCWDRTQGEISEAERRTRAKREEHPLIARLDEELGRHGPPSPDLMDQLERALAASPDDQGIRDALAVAHGFIASECDRYEFTGPKIIHLQRCIELGFEHEWSSLGSAFAMEFLYLKSPFPWYPLTIGPEVPCYCGKTHPRMVSDTPEEAAKQTLACFDHALELDPTNTSALSLRADMLGELERSSEARNDLEKALSILNRALEADDADRQSYRDRAGILRSLGRRQEAIQDLERALALETDPFRIESIKDALNELRQELAPSQDRGEEAEAKRGAKARRERWKIRLGEKKHRSRGCE
jgi:tetratricopeptide (TPR) repeat protein